MSFQPHTRVQGLGISQMSFGRDCTSCSFVALYVCNYFVHSQKYTTDSVRSYLVDGCRDWKTWRSELAQKDEMHVYPHAVLSLQAEPPLSIYRDKGNELMDVSGLHVQDTSTIPAEARDVYASIHPSLDYTLDAFKNEIYRRKHRALGATLTFNDHSICLAAEQISGTSDVRYHIVESLPRNKDSFAFDQNGEAIWVITDDEFVLNDVLMQIFPKQKRVKISNKETRESFRGTVGVFSFVVYEPKTPMQITY